MTDETEYDDVLFEYDDDYLIITIGGEEDEEGQED